MFYPGVVTDPAELRARATQRTAPVHVWVHFGTGSLPGLLVDRRPRRERGGISRWNGFVIYASHNWVTGDVDVRAEWMSYDLLRRK
jgi:hypothetical protein